MSGKNLIPSRSALPCSAFRVSLETEGNGQGHPFAPWPEYKKGGRTKPESTPFPKAPACSAPGGDEFNIPFSRQQLADYLGVERSGPSLELGKMRVEEPPFWCIGKCGYTWLPRSVGLLQAEASFRERSKFKWFGREDKRCPFAMPLSKDYSFAPP